MHKLALEPLLAVVFFTSGSGKISIMVKVGKTSESGNSSMVVEIDNRKAAANVQFVRHTVFNVIENGLDGFLVELVVNAPKGILLLRDELEPACARSAVGYVWHGVVGGFAVEAGDDLVDAAALCQTAMGLIAEAGHVRRRRRQVRWSARCGPCSW